MCRLHTARPLGNCGTWGGARRPLDAPRCTFALPPAHLRVPTCAACMPASPMGICGMRGGACKPQQMCDRRSTPPPLRSCPQTRAVARLRSRLRRSGHRTPTRHLRHARWRSQATAHGWLLLNACTCAAALQPCCGCLCSRAFASRMRSHRCQLGSQVGHGQPVSDPYPTCGPTDDRLPAPVSIPSIAGFDPNFGRSFLDSFTEASSHFVPKYVVLFAYHKHVVFVLNQ